MIQHYSATTTATCDVNGAEIDGRTWPDNGDGSVVNVGRNIVRVRGGRGTNQTTRIGKHIVLGFVSSAL